MRLPTLPELMAGWVISTLLVVTLIDAVAIFRSQPTATVSYQLWEWGREWPAMYLVLGMALGHLAFPLIIMNGH